jgi:hypothetical protein
LCVACLERRGCELIFTCGFWCTPPRLEEWWWVVVGHEAAVGTRGESHRGTHALLIGSRSSVGVRDSDATLLYRVTKSAC